jgi:cysteinyl-tRNA synthetase
MHTNMLNLNGKKMSKSTGNSILPSEIYTGTNPLLSKAYSPIVSRFFMMQAHYSSILDLSDSALLSAEKGFLKLMNAMETLDDISASDTSTYDVNALQEKCYTAMNDDFNTPILIAHLFDGVRIINSVKDGKESLNTSDLEQLKTIFNTFVTDILGFISHKESSGNDLTNEVMELVLQLRGNAKKSKDFDTADLIRDELNKVGIQIKDGREGSSWEVK